MQPSPGTQQQITYAGLKSAIAQVLGNPGERDVSNALEPLTQIARTIEGLKLPAALGAAQVAGLLQHVQRYVEHLQMQVSMHAPYASSAVALIDKLLWLLGHPVKLGDLLPSEQRLQTYRLLYKAKRGFKATASALAAGPVAPAALLAAPAFAVAAAAAAADSAGMYHATSGRHDNQELNRQPAPAPGADPAAIPAPLQQPMRPPKRKQRAPAPSAAGSTGGVGADSDRDEADSGPAQKTRRQAAVPTVAGSLICPSPAAAAAPGGGLGRGRGGAAAGGRGKGRGGAAAAGGRGKGRGGAAAAGGRGKGRGGAAAGAGRLYMYGVGDDSESDSDSDPDWDEGDSGPAHKKHPQGLTVGGEAGSGGAAATGRGGGRGRGRGRGAPTAAAAAGMPAAVGGRAERGGAAATGRGSGRDGLRRAATAAGSGQEDTATFDVAGKDSALGRLLEEKAQQQKVPGIKLWRAALGDLKQLAVRTSDGKVPLAALPQHLPTILDGWKIGSNALGHTTTIKTGRRYCGHMLNLLDLSEVQQVLGAQEVKGMKQQVLAARKILNAKAKGKAAAAGAQAAAAAAAAAAAPEDAAAMDEASADAAAIAAAAGEGSGGEGSEKEAPGGEAAAEDAAARAASALAARVAGAAKAREAKVAARMAKVASAAAARAAAAKDREARRAAAAVAPSAEDAVGGEALGLEKPGEEGAARKGTARAAAAAAAGGEGSEVEETRDAMTAGTGAGTVAGAGGGVSTGAGAGAGAGAAAAAAGRRAFAALSAAALAAGTGVGVGIGLGQTLYPPCPRVWYTLLELCNSMEQVEQLNEAKGHLNTPAGQRQLQAFWGEFEIINQAIQLTQGDTGRCEDVITKKLEDILRCVRPCQGGSSDAATPAAAAAFGSTSAAAAAAGAPASTLSLAAGTGASAGAGTSPVQALPLPGPRELHALLKLCVTVELLTQWDKARDHLRTQAGQGQLQAFWEEYALINRAMQLTHEDMGRRMTFIEKTFTELLKRVQPPQ